MISYKPLWRLLVEQGLKKEDLRQAIKTSPSTIAKMSKNQNVSLDVIERICEYLDCGLTDVIEYVPEQKLIRDWIIQRDKNEVFNANDIHKALSSYNIPLNMVEPVLRQLSDDGQINFILHLKEPSSGTGYKKSSGNLN